jgi:uncharacterized protein YbjT (DUF2867 family)
MSEFLILGGTGKVGSRVSHFLEAEGHKPRVASRAGSTHFDWHRESTWTSALEGTTGVFIVGPGSAMDWSHSLTRFLTLAEQTGVRHAVLLSARGVEFLPDGAAALAEAALVDGPVPWTILRPAHFAQNFTEAMFTPRGGIISAPVGAGKEPFVDVCDIAEVAATILTQRENESLRGKVLALSGPESISFTRAAEILEQVSGSPVEFVPETDEDHIAELRESGVPHEYVRWRMAMLGGIRRGEDAYLSDGIPTVLGRPATTFRAWALREVPRS